MVKNLSLDLDVVNLNPRLEGNLLCLSQSNQDFSLHVPTQVRLILSGDRVNATSDSKQMFNTFKSLLTNLLNGLRQPYKVEITLIGTGYKVTLEGSALIFKLGFSHDVKVEVPNLISCKVLSDKRLTLESADKQALGLFTAKLERLRYPNPYYGTGVYVKDKQYRKKKMRKV